MAAARDQLATSGATNLSLRSIARDVDLVSSAVYRYVASRDDLLTRLITEAYDSLGDAVERAITDDHTGDLDRWVAAAAAIRAWAVASPHEYLLLYGTPVPGYQAPIDTVQPGTRVLRSLAAIVDEAARGGRLAPPTAKVEISDGLRADFERLGALTSIEIDPATVQVLLSGWTQMFGLLGFELTNQTRGVVDHHADLFISCATRSGRAIGLR